VVVVVETGISKLTFASLCVHFALFGHTLKQSTGIIHNHYNAFLNTSELLNKPKRLKADMQH